LADVLEANDKCNIDESMVSESKENESDMDEELN